VREEKQKERECREERKRETGRMEREDRKR
jgi:hypothetical protein